MSLFEKVSDLRTLKGAWHRVRKRQPLPGADGVTVEEFEAHADAYLRALACDMAAGSYQPVPLRRVLMKREDGGERPIVLAAIRDRVVQEALLHMLRPVVEGCLGDGSYAYRTGRSGRMAADQVQEYIKGGNHFVLRGDVARFFETLDHSILAGRLRTVLGDDPIIDLVMRSLTGLVFEEMSLWENRVGVPQGLSLSPLLSNLYMVPFDSRMQAEGFNMVRYADDYVVLAPSREIAEKAREVASAALCELKLLPNEDKWRICHVSEGFTFLGYLFDDRGRGPSEKAVEALGWRLKVAGVDATRLGLDFQERLALYRPIIKGWLGYFSHCACSGPMEDAAAFAALVLEMGAAGRLEEARNLLEDFRSRVVGPLDTETQMNLARVGEELNMLWFPLREYGLILDEEPENKTARQAVGRHIGGSDADINTFVSLVRQVCEGDAVDASWRVGEFLIERGCFGAAYQVVGREHLLEHVGAGDACLPEVSWREADLERYLSLFSGSEACHAQEILTDEGRRAYVHVGEPLDPEAVGEHLRGAKTLGFYLLRADSTVKVLAIDVDVHKKSLLRCGTDEERFGELELLARRDALRLSSRFWLCSIPTYLEWSGYRGFHVWVFLEDPVPARTARRAALRVIADCGKPSEGIRWEVFPKEDTVREGRYGSLLKLPLGIHRASGRRAVFVREDGRPYEDQMAFLRQVQVTSAAELFKVLEREEGDMPAARLPTAGLLAELEGCLPEGGVLGVVRRCPVVAFLAGKARRGGYLDHQERLTLLLVLGHLGDEGKAFLRRVMSWCVNYDRAVTEKFISRLTGKPVSCPKIRQRHPEVSASVNCACRFTLGRGMYPSPVLHAVGAAVAASGISGGGKKKGVEPGSCETALRVESLVVKIAELRRHQAGIAVSIEECEAEIEKTMKAAGLEKLRLTQGTLVRAPSDCGARWIIEV